MSERIRGSYDDALYKSTYTLLYFTTEDNVQLSCHKSAMRPFTNLLLDTCSSITHLIKITFFRNRVMDDERMSFST